MSEFGEPFGRPLPKRARETRWRPQVHAHPIELGYTCFRRDDETAEPQWYRVVGISAGETLAEEENLIHLAPMHVDGLGEPFCVKRPEFMEKYAPLGPSVYFAKQDLQSMTPGEAVMAFGAWLTTLEREITVGATQDSTVMHELISRFSEVQGFDDPRSDWGDRIVPMPKEE